VLAGGVGRGLSRQMVGFAWEIVGNRDPLCVFEDRHKLVFKEVWCLTA
jgi:hypothetical protein